MFHKKNAQGLSGQYSIAVMIRRNTSYLIWNAWHILAKKPTPIRLCNKDIRLKVISKLNLAK